MAITRFREVVKIEETQINVPLLRVVEHIVGDLHHLVASRRRLKNGEWDRALTKLSDAVRDGKLKVGGFRAGSEIWEAVPAGEFPTLADNPLADFDFALEFSDKRIVKFDEHDEARIVRTHSQVNEMPTVLWTGIRADSGAEVLRLWPPKVPPNLRQLLEDEDKEKLARFSAHITGDEAKEIARKAGVTIGQKPLRDLLDKVRGGKIRPGPKGPRTHRA